MGFSVSAAAAIIGVAILLSFEFMVANVIPTITDTHDSYDEMRDRAIDQIQTNINITSVSTPNNGSNYDHNITVENTGSITLETANFNVLINGTKYTYTCSKTYLHPENEVYFNITNLPGNGAMRAKVVTDNGISDYYDYTIT
jgi:archaellum component FlaF (FlaF/FlaG flagellin family)